MSDRICPCGMSFPYPSHLKRHQNGKLGCAHYLKYLYSLNSQSNVKVEKEDVASNTSKKFLCKYCDKNFATKFTMERHYKTCKKNKDNNINNSISNIISNILNHSKCGDLTLDIDKNGNTKIHFAKTNN